MDKSNMCNDMIQCGSHNVIVICNKFGLYKSKSVIIMAKLNISQLKGNLIATVCPRRDGSKDHLPQANNQQKKTAALHQDDKLILLGAYGLIN